MRLWWHKKVLAARGSQKSLQPIIIILHTIFLHEIQRSRVLPHLDEKFRRGHKDRELQFWLMRAIRLKLSYLIVKRELVEIS